MIIFKLCLSICLASFCGLVALRLPLGYSIVRDRSRCDVCAKPLKWYHEIPIISYLLLRGRCAYCHRRIYPGIFWIEVIGLIIGIEASLQHTVNAYLLILVGLTIALGAMTDYIFLSIWPVTLIPAYLACIIFNFPNWHQLIFIGLFSLFIIGFYFCCRPRFGLGDCEILILISLLTPSQTTLQIVLIACSLALIGFLILYHKHHHRILMPFIPFILIAFILRFLF